MGKNTSALAWVWTAVIMGAIYGVFHLFPVKATVTPIAEEPKLSNAQLHDRGADCNTRGDFACSEKAFSEILKLDSGDRSALANLAMAQTQLGKHDQAIANFKTYFAQGGQGVDAMASLAQSLYATGDKKGALKRYGDALKAYPQLIDVTERMISIDMELGRRQDAIAVIDSFAKNNPNYKNYFAGLRRNLTQSDDSGLARNAVPKF